ncbi:MAG: hypothetical protein V2A76_06565 [Planctomycetota bacterium]
MAKSTPRIIYANTLATGFMFALDPLWVLETTDWGDITGSQDHDVVTDLSLGYGVGGPAAAFRYRVYDNYIDSCPNPMPPTLLDISLTGLPGSPTGAYVGWVVSIDLEALGACFFLDEGPFGYSYSYLGDSQTGPLLAYGGTGNEDACDITSAPYGCGRWAGGTWFGFWLELAGHDGIDTFPGGCGGGLALQIAGPTCSGDTVSIEVSGASAGDWWAVAIGTSVGPGLGGTLGGCPVDVVPVIPIWLMGRLPTQPLTVPATVSLASGLTVGLQVITRNASGVWDSSNTEIINVP